MRLFTIRCHSHRHHLLWQCLRPHLMYCMGILRLLHLQLFRPQSLMTLMHVCTVLSSVWGRWECQMAQLFGMISRVCRWLVCRARLGCLTLRGTRALVVLASTSDFTAQWWEHTDWMSHKWSLCSRYLWVGQPSASLHPWSLHDVGHGTTWLRSSYGSFHLTLS